MNVRTAEDSEPRAGATSQSLPQEPALAEAELSLLAPTRRAGVVAEPRRSGDLVVGALRLVVAISVLASFWMALHWWHPAVAASYDSDVSRTLDNLALGRTGGSGASAYSSVPTLFSVGSAYAQTVALIGASDEGASIDVPVPQSACRSLAAELAAACDKGELITGTSISVVWSSPQPVYLAPASVPGLPLLGHVTVISTAGAALDLRIVHPATPREPALTGAPAKTTSLDLSFFGEVSWCTGPPTKSTALIIRTAGQSVTIRGKEFSYGACSQDLSLVVAPMSGGPGGPPQTEFGGVTSFDLHAVTGDVSVQSIGGPLHLGDAGTDRLTKPVPVTLAAGPNNVYVTLDVAGNGTELHMTSADLTAAVGGRIELVTSWWHRHRAIALPSLLAGAGLVILGLVVLLVLDLEDWRRAVPRTRRSPTSSGQASWTA